MTSKNTYIEDAALINSLAKTIISRSNALLQLVAGSATILKHTLKSIFFPFALTLDIISTLLVLIKFKKLDNKNLGHSTQLLLSTITMALTLVALCFFFASTYTMVVGALFIASTAISTLYNTSLFFYNLYQWRKRSSETKARYLNKIYQSNSKKYGITALLSLIISVSTLISLLLFPYLAPAVLIGIGNLTSIAVIAGCAYAIYNYTKIPTLSHDPATQNNDSLVNNAANREEAEIEEGAKLLDNLINDFRLQKQENTPGFDYYAQAHRYQQLGNNIVKNREFLLTQIFEKINLLDKQITHSRGQPGERLWKEEEKRIEKVSLLLHLAIFLLPIDTTQAQNAIQKTLNDAAISTRMQEKLLAQHHEFNEKHSLVKQSDWYSPEAFNAFSESLQTNKVFQSFFKNTSDVKDIYQAVQHHFTLEKISTLDTESKTIQMQKEKLEKSLQQKKDRIINSNVLADSLAEPYYYSDNFSGDHL